MKELNVEEVHNRLTENIKNYISLIIKEYGLYMPSYILERLKKISDYSEILKIYDYGEVNAYANEKNIIMPLCADRILSMLSRIPGYGINKKHKPYNNDNIVINNNTFFTYINHVFISGTNAENYYEDLLLHETMHFCGSDGASVLKEGINELLTRILAQKYNLRTNSCGYPKEVQLSYKLMKIFGENIIKTLAFIHNRESEIQFIYNELGEEAADMYQLISDLAEKEFYEEYYSHMSEFKGVVGIVKKAMFYKKIDYSQIYEILENYKLNHENKSYKKI